MKIGQLLEIISASRQERTVSGNFRNSEEWGAGDDKKEKERGRDIGSFSIVKPGSDPHTIKKSSKSPDHQISDGYWRYIEYVIKYKLWENPHFPRVYNIKKIQDAQGDIMMRGEIEKLTPLTNLRIDEIQQLYQYIYGVENVPYEIKKSRGLEQSEVKNLYLKRLATDIFHSIKGLGNQRIKLDSFEEAIRILKMIKEKEFTSNSKNKIRPFGFIYDIKAENIMVRRTPYGPQLVFSDPFV